jgi:hypothetical protein
MWTLNTKEQKMAGKIFHYQVTKGWGKVKEGLRFEASTVQSKPFTDEIDKGLAAATGLSLTEARTIRPNLKYEEV